MTLLKAGEFVRGTVPGEIFNLNDIAAEARAMIEDAQRERERILAQASRDIDRLGQQAKDEGYRTGHEDGLAQGRQAGHEEAIQQARRDFAQSNDETIKALTCACRDFDQAKQQLLWQAEQGTVALAVSVAEKIVKQIGMVSRDTVVENLKAALDLVAKTTNVLIKVNEKDIEHLQAMAGKNESLLGSYAHVKFEVDKGIAPGGCVLCTEHGQIDAQLDTQINRIADELLMTDRKESK